MIRSERLIKLGDSWFSAKSIEVEFFISYILSWGRALDKLFGGSSILPNLTKLRIQFI